MFSSALSIPRPTGKTLATVLVALHVTWLALPVFAQEAPNPAPAGQETVTKDIPQGQAEVTSARFISAALAIGLPAGFVAVGQGIAAGRALEGIARNPSAYGRLFMTMILALALMEALAIYALIIAFSILP